MHRYDRSVLEAHPASDPAAVSPELQAKIKAAGWPDGLIDRIMAIRVGRSQIDEWLDAGWPDAAMLDVWVADQAHLLSSTLTVRQATWSDGEMLTDLCANSPETVGEWEVTVERGPNPYAQYRLQEQPSVQVLEDLKVGLGMTANSVRNTIIAGERTSVNFMSGWRVRDGFRGMGLSKMLQQSAGPGVSWFGLVTYWYVRSGNEARSWIDKVESELADRPGGFGMGTDTLSATTTHFRSGGRPSDRIRPATDADLPRCIELINRTHRGLDLFRPYTIDFIEQRLHDLSWGPKPSFIAPTYGWDDFGVIEQDGEIVACGGLWDRGRDVRDVWRHHDSGEHVTADPTAILDLGFADGRHLAAAELLAHYLDRTQQLGRSGMLAALEFLPDLAAACAPMGPQTESRELHVMPFSMPDLKVEAVVTRPYTDLVYW